MDNETFNISGTLSPTHNPFGTGNVFDQDTFNITSFKDVGRPSIIVSSNETFLARGIPGNSAFVRDSLIDDILPTNIRDSLVISPKESLGILNISSMDLDRESIGIFNINNPIFKKESNDNERTYNNLGIQGFPNQIIPPLLQIQPNPQISLNSFEENLDICNLTDFNKAFLFPHSRKISEASSKSSAVSTNPSFNSKSFEEPSKIVSSFLYKDAEQSPVLMPDADNLNEAFHLPASAKGNSLFYKSSSTHYSFANNFENIKNRIRSLPMTLENLVIDYKVEKISFDDGLICRGIEDERNLEDSVFLQDKMKINEDTSFNCEEKPFDSQRYLLDCTPQPDWNEMDLSKSNSAKSPVYNKESVFKQIDKMLGMQPVNLEEKLKLKSTNKSDEGSSVNISQNLSKISRASQCNISENPSYVSNNENQDISKSNKFSEENVLVSIKAITTIINKKENLSEPQRNKLHHMLHYIADALLDNANMDIENYSFEPSPVESQLDKNKHISTDESVNETSIKSLNKNIKCNKKSCDNLSLSKSLSVRSPPPYMDRSRNHTPRINTSDTNRRSGNMFQESPGTNNNCNKVATKNDNTGGVAPLRRQSSISQNKINMNTDKLKRNKIGTVPSKKGPLRAVLPVENMAKTAKEIDKLSSEVVTSESKGEVKKLTFKSSRTSTPVQEPKLRPIASSTPQARLSQDIRERSGATTNAGKPKLTRSFSYHSRVTSALDQGTNGRKSTDVSNSNSAIRKSSSKLEGIKMLRRNSVTGNNINRETNSEGSPKLKRSSSTGKDSKILSALSRVRQNLLNSPYYNARNSVGVQEKIDDIIAASKAGPDLNKCNWELKSLSKLATRRVGKENVKP